MRRRLTVLALTTLSSALLLIQPALAGVANMP